MDNSQQNGEKRLGYDGNLKRFIKIVITLEIVFIHKAETQAIWYG